MPRFHSYEGYEGLVLFLFWLCLWQSSECKIVKRQTISCSKILHMVPAEQLTMRMDDSPSPFAMLALHIVMCAQPHQDIFGPKLMAENQKVDLRV